MERFGRNHAFYIGNRISERRLIDGKCTERFYPNFADIALTHFVGHNGNHSADGSLDVTHIVSVQINEFFQILVRIHQIFTDNDVNALGAFFDTRTQNGRNIGKYSDARGSEDNVSRCDFVNRIVGRYRTHVLYLDFFLFLIRNYLYGIGMSFVQFINQFTVYIDKNGLEAAVVKKLAEKASADISAAVYYCFHI